MMKKPLLIGITGGSGSGKTTFIKKIAKEFTENEITLISQDDYYKPQEDQKKDSNGEINYDLPSSIYSDELLRDLLLIQDNNEVERIEYTFNNPLKKAKKITFKPTPIIIIEGLFIFHYEAIKKLFDLKLFIETDDVKKVIRRIKRDQSERNYPLKDVLYRYESHTLPAYQKYINPYKNEADFIINNYSQMESAVKVIMGYLKNHLKK